MLVAVTGASGHVGSCLCGMLLDQGFNIRILVHKTSRYNGVPGVEEVKGSLSEPDSIGALCKGADAVIHMAARISIRKKGYTGLYETNVEGTRNIIQGCIKHRINRLVHFSSIHALNPFPLDEPMDENRGLVFNAPLQYERTKAVSESLVLDAVREGLNAVVMNPTAIIGPYDFSPSLAGQALIRIYNRKIPGLVPGGYDWVDVRDVSKAALSALTAGKAGERYLVSGHWASLEELVRMIEEVTDKKLIRTVIPFWLAKVGVPFLAAYSAITGQHPLYTSDSLKILKISHRFIDSRKARKVLGHDPRPLKETIKDTMSWFVETGKIDDYKRIRI